MLTVIPTVNAQMAGNSKNDAQNERLLDACQQFEAFFTSSLLRQMRGTVPDDGLIPRSSGEKIFQEMLDSQYALQMSQSQGIGLARMLYRQLQPDTNGAATIQQSGVDLHG